MWREDQSKALVGTINVFMSKYLGWRLGDLDLETYALGLWPKIVRELFVNVGYINKSPGFEIKSEIVWCQPLGVGRTVNKNIYYYITLCRCR